MLSPSTSIEGHWTIVDHPQHPECSGIKFEISRDNRYRNMYNLHTHVVNSINCSLKLNPYTKQWKVGPVTSTRMLGPPEAMQRERIVINLLSNIRKIKLQDGQLLIIKTKHGERVQLARAHVTVPQLMTNALFNYF